jgi:hypothetical protein
METKKIALTPRDKEIIFLVAKALGFNAELNSDKQITKESVCMLLLNLKKENWSKYNFHEICVAGLSFIRACRKVHRDIQKYIPDNLKAIFPVSIEAAYI